MHRRSILFLSHFFGKNPGNFIPSLLALEDHIRRAFPSGDIGVVYSFPEACREFLWCQNMLQNGKSIYFYPEGSPKENLKFLETITNQEHIVLIHTHFEALGRAIYLFRLKHPQIPVVWHKHNDFTLGVQSRASVIKRRIKDYFIDRFLITVAVSPHLKTPRGHVLLNHLVRERVPEPNPSIRTQTRASIGLSENDIMVLMFGWDKTLKGVDIGCRMLEHLPAQLKERCKLCVILDDTYENRAYIAKHCPSPESVILLNQTDDIFSYHTAADVMLSAARSEAFAYTIFEALAVGTPVVSSDIPGVQWSKAYQNVHFFPSGNAEACAAAVEQAISQRDSLLNQEIADRVRSDFSIDKWCQWLLQLYQSTGIFEF